MSAEAVIQPSHVREAAAGRRAVVRTALWLVAAGNGAAIVWLWLHGGGVIVTITVRTTTTTVGGTRKVARKIVASTATTR